MIWKSPFHFCHKQEGVSNLDTPSCLCIIRCLFAGLFRQFLVIRQLFLGKN